MPANVGPWPKWRSRSPRAPGPVSSRANQTDSGWAAMRKGAPERRPRARGKFPSLDTTAERESALAVVRAGRYAVSSQAGVESHRRFILKALGKWRLSPYPSTVDKVEMIAAALKAGNYRSPANYLGQYSADSERAGYDLSDPIRRAFRDMNRSCARGLGPGVKSKGLPMERLRDLPKQRQPWTPGGPICPRNAIVVGSWFLTREVELATSRACLVRITEAAHGHPATVSWSLPASKSDPRAEGVERTHRCACSDGRFSPGCPVCAMRDHLSFLRKAFPKAVQGSTFSKDFPLFPTESGGVCSKESITETLPAAADLLEVPQSSADGSEVISGHTLRVTGAQGLARLGLDLWAIQLFGRWGTEAVKGYVRLIPLEHVAHLAAHAAKSRELAALVSETTEKGKPTAAVLEKAVAKVLPEWSSTAASLAEPLVVEVITASPLPPRHLLGAEHYPAQ